MVEQLFRHGPPAPSSALLDPGCGDGPFIDGVIRWCERKGTPMPRIVGIESDPSHVAVAKERFARVSQVQIRQADFLGPVRERFDYAIGNPPYVPITALTLSERETYRRGYRTAKGRFDLYLLFYEQALGVLKPGGRLVFITPEKFLYVETARPLRDLLRRHSVEKLHFLNEQTFGELVTYPLVTTIAATPPGEATVVVHRDGQITIARLDASDGRSWLPTVLGADEEPGDLTLGDICTRVSCGIATGADRVFVVRNDDLDPELRRFAHPTIAGRQIAPGAPLEPRDQMLIPYAEDGRLLPEAGLGALGRYLADRDRRAALLERTCVRRKPWYAFHETPPLADVRRPKLLCKDITPAPFFVADRGGTVVPRHSVYYVVPADPDCLDELRDYLDSPLAQAWLRGHCQRAANGFLRVQSHILKRLPLPAGFAPLRKAPDARLQLEAHLA
jgi:SAM-dependent methyltransferase